MTLKYFIQYIKNEIAKRKRTERDLGLCFAYHVIKPHSEKINKESKMGKGTEITIRLPSDSE